MNNNPGRGLHTIDDLEELIPFLDPEIVDLVVLLKTNGFKTFTSCSGEKGHAFPMPTVRMSLGASDSELLAERDRLIRILDENGYSYCYDINIKYVASESQSFLELEFWDQMKRRSDAV